MKKLKSENLETNITKLILLSIALTVAMVAFISSASAAVPNNSIPNYGTATVDGNIVEWNQNEAGPDYFAPMYEGWNQNSKDRVLSKLYLRSHCNEDGSVTMYALVLTAKNPDTGENLKALGDGWIAIGDENDKVVQGSDGLPSFAWVYAADGTTLIGYEASFTLAGEGSYDIIAHLQVNDANGIGQTSGTYNKAIPLVITCPTTSSTASIGNFVWDDLNRNGVQDGGEPGIDGVTVNLYKCGTTSIFKTTITQSGGYYLFDELEPGSYQVEFILKDGYTFTKQNPNTGDDVDKNSDANTATGMTDCTDLIEKEYDPTWDAGMYKLVEKLDVTKTAVTSYTRTHNWDITKSVTTKNGYTHEGFPKIWLYTDGTGNEPATWTVDVTYGGSEDSNFDVSGVITIENNGDLPATITSISDVLGGTPIEVTLPTGVVLPYTLPVGEKLECSYNKPVDSKIVGSNDVTVTTESNKNYDGSAEIVWSEPSKENYKTINVNDISDLFGEKVLGTVTAPGNGHFTYTKDFAWAGYGKDNGGDYTYHNIATIKETGQSADATLKVNVQKYVYETAYAMGSGAVKFIPTFTNWGWTNKITTPGTYTMDLWAGAAQCDTSKGTNVGTVTVVYSNDGYVTVTYNVAAPYTNEETHVYAGYDMFPKDSKGKLTVAPGAYSNHSPFTDLSKPIYVIAHAKVGIPDPNFGPSPV